MVRSQISPSGRRCGNVKGSHQRWTIEREREKEGLAIYSSCRKRYRIISPRRESNGSDRGYYTGESPNQPRMESRMKKEVRRTAYLLGYWWSAGKQGSQKGEQPRKAGRLTCTKKNDSPPTKNRPIRAAGLGRRKDGRVKRGTNWRNRTTYLARKIPLSRGFGKGKTRGRQEIKVQKLRSSQGQGSGQAQTNWVIAEGDRQQQHWRGRGTLSLVLKKPLTFSSFTRRGARPGSIWLQN